MAAVSYLKGVRTRFRNTLSQTLSKGKCFIQSEFYDMEKSDALTAIESYIDKIQLYVDKVEMQSDKIVSVLSESEPENTEQLQTIAEENESLFSDAIDCQLQLKRMKERLIKVDEISKPSSEYKEMIDLQHEFQNLVVTQMQQQKDQMLLQQAFFERQEKKDIDKTMTVNLPKLDMCSFNGDKLKWREFWDTFNTSIHSNKSISEIQKFNYLRSKLYGEARSAIFGLELSCENYCVAVKILQERFGNAQEVVDLHYNKLINIQSAADNVQSLRFFVDKVEKHLRSLEVLQQDINQDVFIAMIRSKLPETVLLQLEMSKGANEKWTLSMLRNKLNDYIIARMRAEKRYNNVDNKTRSNIGGPKRTYSGNNKDTMIPTFGNRGHVPGFVPRGPTPRRDFYGEKGRVTSGEALVANNVGEVNDEQNNESGENNSLPETGMISSGEMILMQTVKTNVSNPQNGKVEEIRILLDSGSQRSYVSESLAKRLDLKSQGIEEISVMTFGNSKSKNVKTKISSLQMTLKDGRKLDISVNIVPIISGTIHRKPVGQLSENANQILKTVDLADSIATENESCEIEMLLGNDFYLDIVLCQKLEIQPGLYLLSSKCGWILSGRTKKVMDDIQDVNMLILTHGHNLTKTNLFVSIDRSLPVKPNLEDFWSVESIGILDNPNVSNDEKAMKHFKDTLKFSEGRYQVTWPWKDEEPNLRINRELAYGRLKSVLFKMQRKPELMKMYSNVIEDQINKGIIEKVGENTAETGRVHYIPHHAVVTPSKTTTKLRVVYDASAKTKQCEKSLNENLYRGPVMLHDLCGMLMRFRLHKIAMVADIEKAFLQVGLQPSDRDVTRFLWIKDVNKPITEKNNIIEYRFCRVPFGVISSPFLLGATIETHLESYDTKIANKLKNDIYVDNLVTGANSFAEAVNLYQEAKSIFDEISMNLREWITNDERVNTFIESKDRATQGVMKVLGHNWDTETDHLSIKHNITTQDVNTKQTKRSVLKAVASMFDPLGLYSPVVLQGKLLIQSLWCKGLEWDDEIGDEEKCRWETIKNDLRKISDCKLQRCVTLENFSESENTLACFCDASAKAYSCCIYFHQELKSKCKAELVFSKTRLAPVKQLTIPKLEIMAVLIGVRCLRFVQDQLKLDAKQSFLWTDSQCVLHWVNTTKDQPVFVRNRVTEIKTHTNVVIGYVPTFEDPADIGSRGTSTESLQNSDKWWHGPQWLSLPKLEWPKFEVNGAKLEPLDRVNTDEVNTGADHTIVNMCVNLDAEPYGIDINKFSSMSKLLRVTAYVTRFLENIREKKSRKLDPLTSSELKQSETMWLKHIQGKHFSKILSAITTKKHNNLQRQLGLFIDEVGLTSIRCRGRLEHADLTFGARHPILLPKNETFTKLLVLRSHAEILHSGVSQTLSKIRNNYWIIRGRTAVKSALRKCLVCRRAEGGPYKMPNIPPLPKSRVSESAPFSRTGLDYLGPLFIKTESYPRKVWVCLFTCLVTRAAHLEMVEDMSTEEFLLAFRRFISQRGTPEIVISDNALQFKTATKILENVLNNVVNSDDVQNYASNAKIKWNFIVELSPWMGGYYERLVGLVKRTLRKTIGRTLLTRIQLQTLLKETEAVLNSRPLVYLENDIDSCIHVTITPGHFLSLNRNLSLPELQNYDENDEDYLPFKSTGTEILKLWKKGHKHLNSFWKLWRNDYLLSLRERTQSKLKSGKVQSEATPSIGDIVHIKDDLPRGCWKCGKIVELPRSFDGEIRSAKVRLPSGRVIGRPLNLLFPLETSENRHISETSVKNGDEKKTFKGERRRKDKTESSDRC